MRNHFGSIFSTAVEAARLDLMFFKTHPKFVGAIVLFLIIPTLYGSIYLSSMWDPASQTRNLSVILVNEDKGVARDKTNLNIGAMVVDRLQADGRFSYRILSSGDEARRIVNQGQASFAILIPHNFSQLALAGRLPGAATIIVHVSEGNDYAGAGFARRFAPELVQRINQTLNEHRFAAAMGRLNRQPGNLHAIEGTPAGLSESVRAHIEVSAKVANQGTGMAPNFVPLSLWVGASLCTYLFAFTVLPESLKGRSSLGIALGKLFTPAIVVLCQATVLSLTLYFVLHIQIHSIPRFTLTLALTALTFLAVMFMLIRLFGNAGRLFALVLLVIQLASSGATLPVELSSPFFQAIHPWLPLSWVVRAVRIALFDAYEGAWWQTVGAISLMLSVAVAVASLPKKWKLVQTSAYEPILE